MMRRTLPIALTVAVALSPACRRAAPNASQGSGAEARTLDETSWTQQTELYMEHPPLVAGRTVRFAVHLTRLADFQALNAGRPSIEMSPGSGGPSVVLPGSEPLRPGAFRVEGTLPAAGRYRWALIVYGARFVRPARARGDDRVRRRAIGGIADAEKRPEKDPAAIAYLKEQQWTNPFATAVVREGDVRTSIRVPAAIEPVTGGEAIVAAPADGRYASGRLPSVGDRVSAGQELGRLEPRLSEAAKTARRSSRPSRKPRRRWTVRRPTSREPSGCWRSAPCRPGASKMPAGPWRSPKRVSTAAQRSPRAARRGAAQRRRRGIGQRVRASRAHCRPRRRSLCRAGRLVYDEGAPLFRVVRRDRVELQAQVPPNEATAARTPHRGWRSKYRVAPNPSSSSPITSTTPASSIRRLARCRCRSRSTTAAASCSSARPARPSSTRAARSACRWCRSEAVLMEAGRPYVFVQIGGEQLRAPLRRDRLARRRPGRHSRAGVKPGDRVVTRGAYDVQLPRRRKDCRPKATCTRRRP